MATEDLDEMIVRKARQASATWGTNYLEGGGPGYYWQPETLQYSDLISGKEVWVLSRTPAGQEYSGMEYGIAAWSHDGSTIGYFSPGKGTNNPTLGMSGQQCKRRVVRANGLYQRACEGRGRGNLGDLNGFGWASTEKAYYCWGTYWNNTAQDGYDYILYKQAVDDTNLITPTIALDTSALDTTGKASVKNGIFNDDSWFVFRGNAADYPTPNDVNSQKIYFAQKVDGVITIINHWGAARGCGPAADPYGNHTWAKEVMLHTYHAIAGPRIFLLFSDTNVYWSMDRSGSYADGGPVWSDWGPGFGEICCESCNGDPVNPYGIEYQSHPAFDRWGRYAVVGRYDVTGTSIWDVTNHTFLANFIASDSDGHHGWQAWSDHVVKTTIGGLDGRDVVGNIYTGSNATKYLIASVHYPIPDPITLTQSLPRPSQSPDGTKVVFNACWLNASGDSYPYINYAVAYYPHPPKITGAANNGANIVRITWAWDAASKYTTRGWPVEGVDDPPVPREIKYYHVWVSPDNATWTELTTTGVAWGTLIYDAAQASSTTRYYAVTSEEHSTLESRCLSNTWKVILDGDGLISTQAQQTAYPADPGAISAYWTTAPTNATALTATPTAVAGHYTLAWTEPAGSKKRYYNIYYTSDLSAPTAARTKRIASIPVGVSSWLDWNAHQTVQGRYGITTVDRQGNESTILLDSSYVGAKKVLFRVT